jgi:hypothetical protein
VLLTTKRNLSSRQDAWRVMLELPADRQQQKNRGSTVNQQFDFLSQWPSPAVPIVHTVRPAASCSTTAHTHTHVNQPTIPPSHPHSTHTGHSRQRRHTTHTHTQLAACVNRIASVRSLLHTHAHPPHELHRSGWTELFTLNFFKSVDNSTF